MSGKQLGFAIVGTGTIARVHAAALRDIPNAYLVLGYSRNRAQAESFARDFDCQATDDLQAVLQHPEVNTVIVTTSSGSHATLAIDAMAAGKHVVVEKPMAMTTEQARAMIQASTRYGRHLSVIFQRRYEPLNQAAKQAIDSGALGRILFADVMRESVDAACSYVRSRARVLRMIDAEMKETDLHIHFPAGSVPKDGPSAGVAVTLAIASVMSRQPVRRDVAVTGEVTLRGRVLEIGGVKEKVLAAYRSGLREVMLPAANEKDLREVPPAVRERVRFTFVESMDQVLAVMLLPSGGPVSTEMADGEEVVRRSGEMRQMVADAGVEAIAAPKL